MNVSAELAVIALGLSFFAGFAVAHKQRDADIARQDEMRRGWEEIRSRAIQDGILDADGRPVEKPE